MSAPEPVLRRATFEDLPGILALLADGALSPEPPGGDKRAAAAFAEIEASGTSAVWVLEDGGTLVGCAQLTAIPGLSQGGMKRAVIEAVRVAPARRGQGLGRWLIRRLVESARRDGCGVVQLMSDKRRLEAHRFYVSLGFRMSHEGFKLYLDKETT